MVDSSQIIQELEQIRKEYEFCREMDCPHLLQTFDDCGRLILWCNKARTTRFRKIDCDFYLEREMQDE